MLKSSNASGDGLKKLANHLGLEADAAATAHATDATNGGQPPIADHLGLADSAVVGRATDASGNGHPKFADHIGHISDAVAARAGLIAEIKAKYRERCFLMGQRKRLNTALGAYIRMQMGWHASLPKIERDKIKKAAATYIKTHPDDENVHATANAAEIFEEPEKAVLKEMAMLAEHLPVWKLFEDVRGFAGGSLAVIVGEAGDLSLYRNHSALWKRLGLGVIDGRRQGAPIVNTPEEWIRHGYSKLRRSRIWNIGDALIKGNGDGKYRTTYLRRKAYELARDPEIRPIVAHRRAQRYMEKQLIRDLFNAWKRLG
jgi:hypothetical protein